METISVTNVREQSLNGRTELVASVSTAQDSRDIWMRSVYQRSGIVADPFIPALLCQAMRLRIALTVDGSVTAGMLCAAEKVQRVRSVWDPSLPVVSVQARKTADPHRRTSTNVGCFFSGGVDSFYTLRKHRDEITHLIFVHGFDIPLHRTSFRAYVALELRRLAQDLGLELVEVETNLREHGDRFVCWEDYHGSAMAAVAHFLSPGITKIYFPSSYAYAYLFPHGSHPGLDPYWSTESLEIVHDGCEADRFDKIQSLIGWQQAVRNLRVCWQCVEGELNCGRCRKCLWTMAFLRACGALEQAGSFPQRLDLDALRRYPPTRLDEYARFASALACTERLGTDPDLAKELRAGLDRADSSRRAEARVGKWVRRLAALCGSKRKAGCGWKT